MSKVSEQEKREVFEKIHENYNHLNQLMVEELALASKHGGITGNYREQRWMQLFRSIIPKKFTMAQGVLIIDSQGEVSKEVDIAVYDEQYTPYVFQYNNLKFIPIEAVAVTIQCKSIKIDTDELKEWADSIICLKPKRSGIARMVDGYVCGITNKTQVETKPIRIVVTLKASKEDKTINFLKDELKEHYHFIIQEKIENKEKKELVVNSPHECKTLGWWAKELNGRGDELHLSIKNMPCECEEKRAEYVELEFEGKDQLKNTIADLRIDKNPLLTLNFQLNQLLMLLNNPMLFPHFAYAKLFREMTHGLSDNEKCE